MRIVQEGCRSLASLLTWRLAVKTEKAFLFRAELSWSAARSARKARWRWYSNQRHPWESETGERYMSCSISWLKLFEWLVCVLEAVVIVRRWLHDFWGDCSPPLLYSPVCWESAPGRDWFLGSSSFRLKSLVSNGLHYILSSFCVRKVLEQRTLFLEYCTSFLQVIVHTSTESFRMII